MCCLHLHMKENHKIFVQTFRSLEYVKYSIRFQVLKLKLSCVTLKNEKFLPDITTKCGDIANGILNAAIDATNFQMQVALPYYTQNITLFTHHEQVCLTRLSIERCFSHHRAA